MKLDTKEPQIRNLIETYIRTEINTLLLKQMVLKLGRFGQ